MAKKKTKAMAIGEIKELLTRIEAAEENVAQAEIELESRKESVKTAKGVWMTAVEDLRELVRTSKRWAEEQRRQPLLNQANSEGQPVNGESNAESQPSTTDTATASTVTTVSADSTTTDAAVSPADWRGWTIDVLEQYGLPPGKVKCLANAFDNMGQLVDRMNRQGSEDHWWKDLKGFGESGYNALVDAIMELRKARPEFQANEKA
jgi:hypothetical protein